MSSQVMPLHYVTVEFRLHDQDKIIEKSGQHRFLYGVEPWIDGVDQQLENLREGEHLEFDLDGLRYGSLGSLPPVVSRGVG